MKKFLLLLAIFICGFLLGGMNSKIPPITPNADFSISTPAIVQHVFSVAGFENDVVSSHKYIIKTLKKHEPLKFGFSCITYINWNDFGHLFVFSPKTKTALLGADDIFSPQTPRAP